MIAHKIGLKLKIVHMLPFFLRSNLELSYKMICFGCRCALDPISCIRPFEKWIESKWIWSTLDPISCKRTQLWIRSRVYAPSKSGSNPNGSGLLWIRSLVNAHSYGSDPVYTPLRKVDRIQMDLVYFGSDLV